MTLQKENTGKRDMLAQLRTRLANERTLLAYVRTSLYFTVGGLTILNVERFQSIAILGWLCFAVSIPLLLIGIRRFFALHQKLRD